MTSEGFDGGGEGSEGSALGFSEGREACGGIGVSFIVLFANCEVVRFETRNGEDPSVCVAVVRRPRESKVGGVGIGLFSEESMAGSENSDRERDALEVPDL